MLKCYGPLEPAGWARCNAVVQRRTIALVAAGLLVLTAGLAPGASTSPAAAPVLATTATGLTSKLFFADPVTLQPLRGRSLILGFNWNDFARSPDGNRLVLNKATRNDRAELRFVNLKTMRHAGAVRFARGEYVRPLAWLTARLVVAELGSTTGESVGGPRLVGIDPVTRKVLWRRSIGGSTVASASAAGRLVVLVAPNGTIGPAKLLVVGSSTRSVGIQRVLAGSGTGSDQEAGTTRQPGLALDSAGKYAYVVSAGDPVAQIDLSALTVSYGTGSRTLAKGMTGPQRQALWLGNGTLAVAGSDTVAEFGPQGLIGETSTPSGLWIVDTKTWTQRLVQQDAAIAAVAGRLILAYGAGWTFKAGAESQTGVGLSIYDLDGTLRAHLFGTTPIFGVSVQGRLAYAYLSGSTRRIAVVDTEAGKVLRTVTRPTLELLAR